ncbi:DUF4186 domain-containing protein [Pseudodonghicola flavimaris]|uniref:DUF4186 domain-containing protein n=1 Tax=Pseudodonghicola flavimaris TaxID=3050036 RepID=A0ABT7F5M4_9RHOB|nr:DUF4186 domain-containing protein [Pseudodonghicola flavimaris]MDK3019805.1 DUF4186 domain-containing protein [Pseudodonghicola flavimaris]
MTAHSALFARLARSDFRSRFRLGPRERAYADAKGRGTIADHARDFIAGRLAPEAPRNDGRQTPMRGHPVFIAQHATGCCCRGCLEKWHGLRRGRPLSPREQAYVVDVLMTWIDGEMGFDPHRRRPRGPQQGKTDR